MYRYKKESLAALSMRLLPPMNRSKKKAEANLLLSRHRSMPVAVERGR